MKIYKSILLASLLLMGNGYHSCYSAGDLPNEISNMDIDDIDIANIKIDDMEMDNNIIDSNKKKYYFHRKEDRSHLVLGVVRYPNVEKLDISIYDNEFPFSVKKSFPNLKRMRIDGLNNIKFCDMPENLEELHIDGSTISINLITNFKKLKKLCISTIQNIELCHVPENLEVLFIDNSNISINLITDCKKLKTLSITGKQYDTMLAEILYNLPKSLEEFQLNHSSLSALPDDFSEILPNLMFLDIGGNSKLSCVLDSKIVGPYVQTIDLRGSKKIKIIDIKEKPLDPEYITVIAGDVCQDFVYLPYGKFNGSINGEHINSMEDFAERFFVHSGSLEIYKPSKYLHAYYPDVNPEEGDFIINISEDGEYSFDLCDRTEEEDDFLTEAQNEAFVNMLNEARNLQKSIHENIRFKRLKAIVNADS
ncbi:MAG: hypothetical protein Q8K37_03575 [Alphaproteobacteria bacterium]|nr:hypothetical protein [Alphaproteobacteria bacterium]